VIDNIGNDVEEAAAYSYFIKLLFVKDLIKTQRP
jgi:hypothetical protein